MFERYTEKARRVIFFARYEASAFGSSEIRSEHLLLGLFREGRAPFNAVFGTISLESIRAQIEGVSHVQSSISTSVDLPLDNPSKRILAYAAEEAERLRQKHIGIEHLFLGILREDKCLAAQILRKGGIHLEEARGKIAAANDQFATRTPTPAADYLGEAVPPTRKPAAIRIVVTSGAEILVSYRSQFDPPRIGESIRMRADDGSTQTYRVQDVVWEMSLSDGPILREVNVRVSLEIEK